MFTLVFNRVQYKKGYKLPKNANKAILLYFPAYKRIFVCKLLFTKKSEKNRVYPLTKRKKVYIFVVVKGFTP